MVILESYLLIILIAILIIYKYFYKPDVVYVKYLDNNNNIKYYLVRNMTDKEKNDSMMMLHNIKQNLKNLINKIIINDSSNTSMIQYVKKINEKIDDVEIQESPADSKYTSYSINKGEVIVFCLRSKITNRLHDLNDLLYVAIHEIAHIGCPEIGHTDLFFKINKYLIQKAIDYNIYKYIDYKKNNKEYCGMQLTSSVVNY